MMAARRSSQRCAAVLLLLLLLVARVGITDGGWWPEKLSLWSEGEAKPSPDGGEGDEGGGAHACGPGTDCLYADYPETQGFAPPRPLTQEPPLSLDISKQGRGTEDPVMLQVDGAGNPRAVMTDEGEEACPTGDQGEGACPVENQKEAACLVRDQEGRGPHTSAMSVRDSEDNCGIACNLKKMASTAASGVTVATDFFSDQVYRKASNFTGDFAESVRSVFHQELYGFFEVMVNKMGNFLSSDALVMMMFKSLSRKILSASLIVLFLLIDYFLLYICSFYFILALDSLVFLLHYLKGPEWVYSYLYLILTYVYDLLILIVSYPKLAATIVVVLFLVSIVMPFVRWSLRRNMHYKIDSILRCVTAMERRLMLMEERQNEVLQDMEERQTEVLQRIEEKQNEFLQRIEEGQNEVLQRVEEKQIALLQFLETTPLSTRNGLLSSRES